MTSTELLDAAYMWTYTSLDALSLISVMFFLSLLLTIKAMLANGFSGIPK